MGFPGKALVVAINPAVNTMGNYSLRIPLSFLTEVKI